MNTKEVYKLLSVIELAYPSFKVLDKREGVELWYQMLQDLNFEDCRNVILEYSATEKFPPSIADIRKRTAEFNTPKELSTSEALNKAKELAVHYGANGYCNAYQACKNISELLYLTVRAIGWSTFCGMNEYETGKTFREIYNEFKAEQEKNAKIPQVILLETQKIKDKKMMIAQEKALSD